MGKFATEWCLTERVAQLEEPSLPHETRTGSRFQNLEREREGYGGTVGECLLIGVLALSGGAQLLSLFPGRKPRKPIS